MGLEKILDHLPGYPLVMGLSIPARLPNYMDLSNGTCLTFSTCGSMHATFVWLVTVVDTCEIETIKTHW